MQRYFITGIGTDVGKTVASAIVTEALKADYWKPIQAGDLDFGDADKVKSWVSNSISVFHKNVVALKTPMSPHAAAAIDNVHIKASEIENPKTKNNLVVEGAGGVLVPISDTETILDLMMPTDRIILVSRHYLGSINHTLLSVDVLKSSGLNTIGILFNGKEHPTTESIIAKMTGCTILGRIDEMNEVNPKTIKEQASLLREHLLNF